MKYFIYHFTNGLLPISSLECSRCACTIYRNCTGPMDYFPRHWENIPVSKCCKCRLLYWLPQKRYSLCTVGAAIACLFLLSSLFSQFLHFCLLFVFSFFLLCVTASELSLPQFSFIFLPSSLPYLPSSFVFLPTDVLF